MVTKKNLWFLTLFSIILVMSIYYVTVPSGDLTGLVNAEVNTGEEVTVTSSESDTITALKVGRDESLEKEVNKLKDILTDEAKTGEEKSDAYEALKTLNTNKGKEESIEKSIKEEFNYSSYVKIDNSNVKVVIDSTDHSYELANKIIKNVQSAFKNKMYITVSFGSK